jgi:hypothetical protein
MDAKEWALMQSIGIDFVQIAQGPRSEWNKLKEHGYEMLVNLETTHGVDGYIAQNEKTTVIAFRGTELRDDVIDVWTDAKFILRKQERGGAVHSGFLDAYSSVEKIIEQYKPQMRENVLIVGHSLGGAMAQLCHVRTFEHEPFCHSISYAGPKVANRKFWNSVLCVPRMLKVVWDLDMVPRLPPWIVGCSEPENGANFWIRDIKKDTKRKTRLNYCENFDIPSLGYNPKDHDVINYVHASNEILEHYFANTLS